MIDISKMRQGNYLQRRGNNELVQIKDTDTYIKVSRCPQIYAPIPLTEEWLLKFWFKRMDGYFLFYKGYRQMDFHVFSWETPVGQSNGVPAGEFYITINGVIVILNTVHQLQNLYHSLTGQELTI